MTNPTPEQVKQAREKSGLTQDKADKLAGGSGNKNTWSQYEKGYRNISKSKWKCFLMETGQKLEDYE